MVVELPAPTKLISQIAWQCQRKSYRGKKIRLRAEVAAAGNQAYLWLRVMRKGFGPAAQTFYDNMADRPITTSAWRDVEIAGDVVPDADAIEYDFALVGEGRAWVDAVALEVVAGK